MLKATQSAIRNIRYCLCCLLLINSPVTLGDLAHEPSFSAHGFGTLGFVYNNDDNAKYIRNSIQTDTKGGAVTYSQDTRAGVQLTASLSPSLSITGQGVSRLNLDNTFKPELSWAYVKYSASPDWDFRAGRLGLDVFFRSDSTDVGYSYLWARPPVDFYGHIVLNKIEGADVTKHFLLGNSSVDIKAMYGSLYDTKFREGNTTIDISNSDIYGLVAGIEFNHLLLRASYFRVNENHTKNTIKLTDAAGNDSVLVVIEPKNVTTYYAFSAAYDSGPWRTQMSFGALRLTAHHVPDSMAAFTSIGYRYKTLTPYLLLSKTAPHSINLNPTTGAKPHPSPNQHTIGLGVRYDIRPNITLKVQAEFINSKSNNSALWAEETEAWDGDANVFSLVIDTVF